MRPTNGIRIYQCPSCKNLYRSKTDKQVEMGSLYYHLKRSDFFSKSDVHSQICQCEECEKWFESYENILGLYRLKKLNLRKEGIDLDQSIDFENLPILPNGLWYDRLEKFLESQEAHKFNPLDFRITLWRNYNYIFEDLDYFKLEEDRKSALLEIDEFENVNNENLRNIERLLPLKTSYDMLLLAEIQRLLGKRKECRKILRKIPLELFWYSFQIRQHIKMEIRPFKIKKKNRVREIIRAYVTELIFKLLPL